MKRANRKQGKKYWLLIGWLGIATAGSLEDTLFWRNCVFVRSGLFFFLVKVTKWNEMKWNLKFSLIRFGSIRFKFEWIQQQWGYLKTMLIYSKMATVRWKLQSSFFVGIWFSDKKYSQGYGHICDFFIRQQRGHLKTMSIYSENGDSWRKIAKNFFCWKLIFGQKNSQSYGCICNFFIRQQWGHSRTMSIYSKMVTVRGKLNRTFLVGN